MRLYIDLDSRQVVTAAGVKSPLSVLYLSRGDALDLELQFVRGSTTVDIDGGTPAEVFFCIKPFQRFDVAPLVLTTSFVKGGTGGTPIWTAQPNLNTTELNAEMKVNGTDDDDVAALTCSAEIGFTVGGRQTTIRTVRCVVENDLYRGDEQETTPSALQGRFTLLPDVTGYTGGGPTKLDGLSTATLTTVPAYFQTVFDGELRSWAVREKTPEDVIDGTEVIQPTDYDADTNDRVIVFVPAPIPTVVEARLIATKGTTAALETVVPDEAELVYDTEQEKLKVGDGATPGGVSVTGSVERELARMLPARQLVELFGGYNASGLSIDNWRKAAKLVTTRTTSPVVTVKTTTGRARGLRWDGTLTATAGTGVVANDITINWGTAPASPYNTRLPKLVAVWSVDAAGNPSGGLTSLACNNNQLTALDVTGLTVLEYLDCQSNQLTALDVTGLAALQSIYCLSNQITSLDLSGLAALTLLSCESNQLTALDVTGLGALEALTCYSNQLTALDLSGLVTLFGLDCSANQLTSLDVSGLATLTTLSCSENQLTSLDASGLAALQTLYCNDNQLTTLDVSECVSMIRFACRDNPITSLRAQGVGALLAGHYGGPVVDCLNNQLSGAALDQLYTDLVAGTPGEVIDVTGNPGTATDTPSIATAKGYVVVGS